MLIHFDELERINFKYIKIELNPVVKDTNLGWGYKAQSFVKTEKFRKIGVTAEEYWDVGEEDLLAHEFNNIIIFV